MARGRDLGDIVRGFIIIAQLVGASGTKTAQLDGVLIGTVTKVTTAFRAMRQTFVNRIEYCGRKCAFSEHEICASVQYVRKNRRATVPQVTDKRDDGRAQTVSSRTFCQQLHSEGYSRVAVGK